MELIKAGIGALGGTPADQWKDFFYCEALPNDVLMCKGEKCVSGRSSNTKGNDNIISNGSGIAVADGQCMIIVEQGKIVEVCAETQDAKGYAEYYNEKSKIYEYKPVEIAGFSGYLAKNFLKTGISTENYYIIDYIDYPLSDGSSVVVSLWVTQKYNEDTKDMAPVAEAFLKNIQVAPINA